MRKISTLSYNKIQSNLSRLAIKADETKSVRTIAPNELVSNQLFLFCSCTFLFYLLMVGMVTRAKNDRISWLGVDGEVNRCCRQDFGPLTVQLFFLKVDTEDGKIICSRIS